MWKKVKGWLGLNKPWQRWDERKLQQVQEYLKQKAYGTQSLDDWTLTAEAIIQRYAPDHMALSQEEYESVKAQLRAKIEKNLANPPAKPAAYVPDVDAAIAGLPLYQTLLSAHQRGDVYAIGCSAVNACPVCQRDIRNQRYKIVDLLAAYHDPAAVPVPVIPYHQCDYINADGGGYCRCSWRIEFQRPAGMSPEYLEWLDQTLKDAGLPSRLP